MKTYKLNDQEYELIKNYRDGFDLQETKANLTDYFTDYDYILGDWAYGKLRLKGFCEQTNKLFKPLNDFKGVEKYIKDYCAYNCRHFILKKKQD